MTDLSASWKPPTMIYWHNGHEITVRLRGLDIYRGMALVALGDRADGYDGDVVRDNDEFDVYGTVACHQADNCPHGGIAYGHRHTFHVYAGRSFHPRKHEEGMGHPFEPSHTLVRVVNPGDANVVKVLTWLREHGAAVLVDVTMPVHSPEMLIGFEPPDSPLHELDNETNRHYWRRGGNAHTQLLAAMGVAHVVTVNNEQTALDAITVNPSVMTVPDLFTDGNADGGTNQAEVMEALGAAQNRAIRLSQDPAGDSPFIDTLRTWL